MKRNRRNARYIALFLLLIVPALLGADLACSAGHSRATPRPGHWAKPLKREGLPNLHRVTESLYRGAQPTAAGMRRLKAMGVKTVVNLRSFHSDRDEIGDTGLGYVHIYMKAWHPEKREVVRFLQVVTDDGLTPAFVHCKHGADRTGLMCAVYRMAICGWTKNEAIAEMTEGGFGYHRIWGNLVRFIEDLDIAAIKERAGIED
ncbi:MAG: tyrosine-protein phosphatase [Deltaproteobacteria bacterium]|nr:tyrosine-protein phosphatase [Deltaproteobacteria bacterium]MBW2121347.1 tyrosine-protein phosphatase [Deltaproteobacteria bacterium]